MSSENYKVDSLVAAIEGDYERMAHSDLVLTCRMLVRGRAVWRKEAEELKALLEEHRQQYANKELEVIELRKALREHGIRLEKPGGGA